MGLSHMTRQFIIVGGAGKQFGLSAEFGRTKIVNCTRFRGEGSKVDATHQCGTIDFIARTWSPLHCEVASAKLLLELLCATLPRHT
jgi:hypothetical protein